MVEFQGKPRVVRGVRFGKLIPRRASAQEGFTLIELMVSVVIISILAALLIPAIKNARSQAAGIQCASNLRQLGIVARTYANEHNQTLPPFYLDPSKGGVGCWAVGLLRLSMRGIFPTDASPPTV